MAIELSGARETRSAGRWRWRTAVRAMVMMALRGRRERREERGFHDLEEQRHFERKIETMRDTMPRGGPW